MASKRGIAGSALGSALLGMVLLRGSAPAPSLPAAESQAKSTPSAASKRSVKTGSKKLTSATAKADARILKGPWLASQKHFAGEAAIPCPTQLSFIPTAKKRNQGRGEAVAATEPESPVALADGTRRVKRGGEQRGVQDSARTRLWCIPDDAQVQAIIATVPDPVQTHMALLFDRIIEAMQMAAQAMGYVIDYYWLPWDIELKGDWGDYDSFVAAAQDQRQNEAQPGLLLFRWDGERQESKPTVLYVFLVGETSTAGINGEQFANAAEYIQQLRIATYHGCPTASCMHIVGPTFSGSLNSLRRLVDAQAARRGISFVVKSGTVSSQSAINLAPFGGKTMFQTFVRTFEADLRTLLRMLESNHDIHDIDEVKQCSEAIPEVAILTELGTTFGGAVVKEAKGEKKAAEEKPPPCYDIFC